MFRVSFFCDDKYVAQMLHMLTGKAIDLQVVPVTNAKKSGGKLAAETGGQSSEMLVAHMKKTKKTHITAAEAGTFLESIGRKNSSADYTIKHAIENGLLRKNGKVGGKLSYVLTGGKK